MKRFYFLMLFFACFSITDAFAERAITASNKISPAEPALEKPKPGSKRWLRDKKHRHNTRRKKYPKMRRRYTTQDVTISNNAYSAIQEENPSTFLYFLI